MARRYHHGNLRQALVDAAIAVAAEHGVHAIKVSALAKELGVSSAAPFRHFATRDELLVAAAEHAAQQLGVVVGAAGTESTDPVEAERAKAVAYVRFATEHPGHFRLITRAEILAQSPTLQALTAASEASLAVLGTHQPGKASPETLRVSAGVLAAQALVFGLARMIVDGLVGPVTPDQAERLAHEVTGVLGTGLRGPAE
ncbi:MAG: TetR/AcrR family transcriptional regulator [Myxococcales bacterium]|nr:TetR/AcrR family transcriptional regulator [Myxococcales bacterium]